MTETFAGTVTGVYELELGDKLSAAAAINDTVLHVYSVVDFDEDGGWIRLNDVVLEYLTRDSDALTITLAAPLAAAAALDDVVDAWDNENGQQQTVIKAVLDEIDGFAGKPVEAYVSQSIAHVLSTTMREGKGETVILSRDQGALEVVGVEGRQFALAALQYLQGGMTTRESDDDTGVDILGVDAGVPGLYIYGSDGQLSLLLSADDAAGVLKFFPPLTDGIAGFINPGLSGSIPQLTIDSGASSAFPDSARILMLPSTLPGSGTVSIDGQLAVLSGLIRGSGSTDLYMDNSKAVIGNNFVPGDSPSAAKTATLHANDIHSWSGGVSMEDLAGGGLTGASIGNGGRVVRTTSSRRYKDDIEPLPLDEALRVLDIEPVTFHRKDEADDPDRRRYPGVIAEQVLEAGAELWVVRDAEGRPNSVLYGELTAALIGVARHQRDEIATLHDETTDLKARVEQLEGMVANLLTSKETR